MPMEGRTEGEDKRGISRMICRPSELPLYPPPPSTVGKVQIEDISSLRKALLEPVAVIRFGVQSFFLRGKETAESVANSFDRSTERFKFVINYLREEDREPQRIGAIAVGTLAGFVLGMRGGLFKRTFYGLIAGTGTAAICYPSEAREYYRETVYEGKLLANVAYNFIYGVKPGDPRPEINFPDIKFPANFSEFAGMASGVGNSVKNMIMPPEKVKKTD